MITSRHVVIMLRYRNHSHLESAILDILSLIEMSARQKNISKLIIIITKITTITIMIMIIMIIIMIINLNEL